MHSSSCLSYPLVVDVVVVVVVSLGRSVLSLTHTHTHEEGRFLLAACGRAQGLAVAAAEVLPVPVLSVDAERSPFEGGVDTCFLMGEKGGERQSRLLGGRGGLHVVFCDVMGEKGGGMGDRSNQDASEDSEGHMEQIHCV